MQALVDRLLRDGVNLGNNILKVDGFINHQLDPQLTREIGKALARKFRDAGINDATKVVTAEVSGIAFALQTAIELDIETIFARKVRPVTMPKDSYTRRVNSPTKGQEVEIVLNPEYIGPQDRVLLVDDFLASGETLAALHDLVSQSGATVAGFGCVIEKSFQNGRRVLTPYGLPIVSLAMIQSMDNGSIRAVATPPELYRVPGMTAVA
ncbi:MAG: xanthine phosphoribosyltransferase [Caldilineaceae bacterium SB0662_bin_9]|uniref:Xanthine phosphoribosyltransferase n=1 Tax=Caldilineaceae bacterium SB0662_bin_9 TaxID=2605258 RepID=A0A6B1DU72_9CHLR|nr:xanthine phosphoribosyltransferase [Caldilineaceae bacterium]MYD90788.1 xanthine phosphoribosyltransferase [Caldilineaceae bacterium SB0662_bin_9]